MPGAVGQLGAVAAGVGLLGGMGRQRVPCVGRGCNDLGGACVVRGLFAGKLAADIKRKIGGASVVLTEYAGPGEVGFSGDAPGTIRAVDLAAGEAVIVRRGGFLAASPSVTLSVALVKRLRVIGTLLVLRSS